MTDEEYIRNRLDRLNQNSHYGIMIDTEITDIVRRHIKRLEEKEMNATSVQTIENVKEMHFTIEKSCVDDITKVIVGASTNDDIFEFHFSGEGCVVFADQWFNMVADKAYKADFESERNKRQMMETENKQLIQENKDLKKRYDRLNKKFNRVMNNNLPETPITDTMIVNDYNRLVEENKKLEKELGEWKKEAAEYLKDIDKVRRKKNEEINNIKWQLQMKGNIIKRNDELKKELALEKAANEAQHKFIREYAGKDTEVQFNYAIDDTEEVSYVIVEKRCNIIKENEYLRAEMKRLREENKDAVAESLKYIEMNNKLQDENEELKYQLRDIQSTKEVVEQKLNTRDNVNHPSHYTGRYECIDVMQDVFGDEATNDFCLCNAFKYIWRARKKNGLEDVKKAVWYLNKYIEEAEKDGVPKGK